MKKFLLLFPLSTLLLAGCAKEESNAVDQSRIYTHYELFYDKNENKTYAKAYFTFGNALGTTLQLSAPAEVSFNNDALLQNAATGVYERAYSGLIPSGTFVYRDADGNTFTNTSGTIVPAGFDSLPAVITISKSQDTYISWNGTALSAGETMYLGVAYQSFTETTAGADSLRVYASALQQVAPGAYIGIMDRFTATEPLQKPAAGGIITVKYRASNKNMQVVN